MKRVTAVFKGIRPLIMANRQAADPLGEWCAIFKEFRDKKNKTEADHRANDENMFRCHLYIHPELKCPFIPLANFHQMLIGGGKRSRKKDKVKSGIFMNEAIGFVLDYVGPKDPEALRLSPTHRLRKLVPNASGGCSPVVYPLISTGWTLQASFDFDENVLDDNEIITILNVAGAMEAVGGWRPVFGRFVVENLKITTIKI